MEESYSRRVLIITYSTVWDWGNVTRWQLFAYLFWTINLVHDACLLHVSMLKISRPKVDTDKTRVNESPKKDRRSAVLRVETCKGTFCYSVPEINHYLPGLNVVWGHSLKKREKSFIALYICHSNALFPQRITVVHMPAVSRICVFSAKKSFIWTLADSSYVNDDD